MKKSRFTESQDIAGSLQSELFAPLAHLPLPLSALSLGAVSCQATTEGTHLVTG